MRTVSYGPEPGVLCDKENVHVSDDANEEIPGSSSITWVLGKPARELKAYSTGEGTSINAAGRPLCKV